MHRRYALSLMASIILLTPVIAGSAYAQRGGGAGRGGGVGAGKGDGQGMQTDTDLDPDPRGLLTEQERNQIRERMKNAETAAERKRIREEHHALMLERQQLRDRTKDQDRDRQSR